jgi:hypothetical protein
MTADPSDTVCYLVGPDQLLVNRLSGDYSPLHSDPLSRCEPVATGRFCTASAPSDFAARAVLDTLGGDVDLTSMSARFTGPVWPGDVAGRPGRGVNGFGPARARLMAKGLVCGPEHGRGT